jgi:hypothetical protein
MIFLNDNCDKKLQSRSCIALIPYPLSIIVIQLYTEIGSRVEGFSFAYRQIYIILIFNNPTISITIHVMQYRISIGVFYHNCHSMPMKKMLFYVKSCSLFDTFLKYLFNIIQHSLIYDEYF